MKRAASTAHTELPAVEGWDFGDYAYGIEPVVLPDPGEPYADCQNGSEIPSAATYFETCWRLRRLGDRGLPAPAVEPCGVPEELFWFRWITGHQVCFVVWHLMAQLLDDVAGGARTAGAAREAMCRYVEGYSAMLLYTSTCPRSIYNALIRPSMRLRHHSFSGGWAPDYAPVRRLLRRQPSPMWNSDAGELLDAIKLHDLVHEGVAAKLVPDGQSLLHQAAVRGLNHRVVGLIYDSYFMTVRRPVPRHHVVAQLLRRLVAIAQDIAVNGLDASGERDRRPPELLTAGVVRCEDNLVGILSEVARHACGLDPSGDAADPLEPAVSGAAAQVARR